MIAFAIMPAELGLTVLRQLVDIEGGIRAREGHRARLTLGFVLREEVRRIPSLRGVEAIVIAAPFQRSRIESSRQGCRSPV